MCVVSDKHMQGKNRHSNILSFSFLHQPAKSCQLCPHVCVVCSCVCVCVFDDLYHESLFTYRAVHLSALWVKVLWCDEASWGLHLPSTVASYHKFSAAADTALSPQATQHHFVGHTALAHKVYLAVPSGSNKWTVKQAKFKKLNKQALKQTIATMWSRFSQLH